MASAAEHAHQQALACNENHPCKEHCAHSGQLHSVMASLTEATNENEGQTMLYIPPLPPTDMKGSAGNKVGLYAYWRCLIWRLPAVHLAVIVHSLLWYILQSE